MKKLYIAYTCENHKGICAGSNVTTIGVFDSREKAEEAGREVMRLHEAYGVYQELGFTIDEFTLNENDYAIGLKAFMG